MLPKRIYTDCEPINQPEGTYRYAEGIVLSYINNAIINEDGTSLACNNYPSNLATPMKAAMFPDNTYVIFSKGQLGNFDRIGYVDSNENYTELIVDNVLNFNLSYPILKTTIDFNYLNQKIVCWTDNYNKPRILNINNIPFSLNISKGLVNPTEIYKLDLFINFKTPIISLVGVEENGSVASGNYSFAIFYENIDGTISNYTTPQLSVNIIDDNNSLGYDKVDGSIPDFTTSKSIKLNLSNLDTNYNYYNLVVISTINNQTSAKIVKKVKISGTTSTVTYIGTEQSTTISINDLLKVLPNYNKAKTLTQIDNRLYLADLESDEEIDYQSYANNIKIFYNTRFVVSTVLSNSSKNNIETGFEHGGVYAFYIRFILLNGGFSRAFHIPGRLPVGNEGLETLYSTYNLPQSKNYKISDTTNLNSNTYTSVITPDGSGLYSKVSDFSQGTNMGFWENEDEFYPGNFPDFVGQKVRHHVFPTIRKCKQVHYSGASKYGSQGLDILGIDVTNIVIPTEIQNKIAGYQICYAQKDYNNSNVFGNDLVLYTSRPRSAPSIAARSFSGGNFDTFFENDGGSFQGSGWLCNSLDYVRGHSSELLKDKPQLSGLNMFLHVEMKLKLDNTGNFLNVIPSGQSAGYCPAAKIDYTAFATQTTLVSDGTYIQPISEFRYVPNNIIDGNIITTKNAECISYKLNNGLDLAKRISPAISLGYAELRGPNKVDIFPFYNNDTGKEETYLVTYRAIKSNLYVSYENQIFVATDKIGLPNQTSIEYVHGGDRFISTNCFLTTGPIVPEDVNGIYNDRTDGKSGFYVFRRFLAESKYNFNLRYEDTTNFYTKYFPKTNITDLWSINGVNTRPLIDIRNAAINSIGYSQDYNKLNNYRQSIVFNPNDILTNKEPFTVIRTAPANSNISSLNSWKTFLINDKFDFNRNRGEILNLENLDNTLLIHHKYSLYRTTSKENLSLSTIEVTIGSGDIFNQTPKDLLLTDVGFLGLQDSFGFILIKGAYIWVNQQDGRIFSYSSSNGLEIISDYGLRNDFYKLLKNNNKQFNVFIGYDDKNDRVLFTFIHLTNSNLHKTISYSVKEKGWISYHKFYPTQYYFNNNNIFYIKGNNLYKLNNSSKKCKYDNDVINPSIIDIVFNMAPAVNKLFFNFNWISKVLNSLGIIQKNKTIDTIQATTSYQDTGEITVIPYSQFGDNSNTRAERNTWQFNKIRDNNTDVFKRKRLVDKYVIVRFKFLNTANLDSTQNSLYLYDFDTKVQKSEI